MKWIDFKSGVRSQKSYIHELESIRGIAIILVMLFHANGISFGPNHQDASVLKSFIVSGNTGVTLFFVLSGFLLSLPFIARLQSEQAPSIRDYYISRILRILPLYYLAILVAILVTGKVDIGISALMFKFVGFEIFPYSVVWWTLAAEVQFYLLLPFIMILFRNRLGLLILLLALGIWAYYYYSLTLSKPGRIDAVWFYKTKSLFGRLPAFAIGIAGAFIYHHYSHKKMHLDNSIRWMCSLGVIILLVCLGQLLQHSAQLGDFQAERTWHMRHSYEALCWIGILLLLTMSSPWGKTLLINKFNALMGKISYSIYLIHVPVMYYIIAPIKQSIGEQSYAAAPEAYAAIVAAFVASVAASFLCYQLIELPFLKIKQHIPTSRKNI